MNYFPKLAFWAHCVTVALNYGKKTWVSTFEGRR